MYGPGYLSVNHNKKLNNLNCILNNWHGLIRKWNYMPPLKWYKMLFTDLNSAYDIFLSGGKKKVRLQMMMHSMTQAGPSFCFALICYHFLPAQEAHFKNLWKLERFLKHINLTPTSRFLHLVTQIYSVSSLDLCMASFLTSFRSLLTSPPQRNLPWPP